MKNKLINLQMFAEGGGSGASAGTGAGAGSGAGVSDGAGNTAGMGGQLSDVGGNAGNGNPNAGSTEGNTAPQKSKSQLFKEMIRGEYKEEFQKQTQNIVNRRFGDMKDMQTKMNAYSPIMQMLSDKYGVDATDTKAVYNALQSDESFFQEEAMKRGMTVENLKEIKKLESENAAMREAMEERERQEKSIQEYNDLIQQTEEFKAKYGLDFDLQEEITEHPEILELLSNPRISFESAYKAVHMDEMMSGAMILTANKVKEQVANSIASRQARPSENGISTSNATSGLKVDVNAMTKAEREALERRALSGETISF